MNLLITVLAISEFVAETSHNILLLHSIVNSIYMFVLTFENASLLLLYTTQI